MNTMRMPGFSAEASLHHSSKHYQAGAMLTGLGQGGEVVPFTISDCGDLFYSDGSWRATYCCNKAGRCDVLTAEGGFFHFYLL